MRLLKKQATIKTSVFGAEFVAMKIGVEAIWGIQYKLWMMDVLIDGPALCMEIKCLSSTTHKDPSQH